MARWLLCACAAAALVLAGCGGGSSSTTTPPPGDGGVTQTGDDAGSPPTVDAGTPQGTDGGTVPPTDGGTTPPTDGGTTPPTDGGTTPPTDGGTTPPTDGGTTPPADGGTTPPADGGTTPPADGGTTTDGGTTSNDCDGLTPPTPGAPSSYTLTNQDLTAAQCLPGETDGTGHLALRWENNLQPHQTNLTFVDPSSSSSVGTYNDGVRLTPIGQASGFIGVDFYGANYSQDIVVLGPNGTLISRSPPHDIGDGSQGTGTAYNDPTGGLIHARYFTTTPGVVTVGIEAVSDTGAVRWNRILSRTFGYTVFVKIGVDRQGNVLVFFPRDHLDGSGPPTAYDGQWFTHDGTAGPIFAAVPGSSPPDLFERVGNGLFLNSGGVWIGEYEPLATVLHAAPAWLVARPQTKLHMVHGGTGYAVIPLSGQSSATCSQTVEVVSPTGLSCGSSTFSFGGACTTSDLSVGYDGTVIQQLPRDREACTASGHQCTCFYRWWPGFYR